MDVIGDYAKDGYAHVRGLISSDTARAFLHGLKQDLGPKPIDLSQAAGYPEVLRRPAFEVSGHYYKPLLYFLWGLTPTVSRLIGLDLAPTYDYLRIYREGDLCLVHADRPACEHSMSLTLDYSDGEPWELQIGHALRHAPTESPEFDFGDEPFTSIRMEIGDAVLYQGVTHRHGRIKPNPNGWSAHLFLHWVERGGPHSEQAFDRVLPDAPVNFSFA